MKLPVSEVTLATTWRVISSRYPRIAIFERIASPERFKALLEIESMTNPRIRQQVGAFEMIPQEDWVTGEGANFIMSAFTKFSPDKPSRFSDGTYGVYYCAANRETAVSETVYHREKFMRDTDEGPELLMMRVLTTKLKAGLHDIRQKREDLPAVYASDDYRAGQEIGQQLKEAKAWGIAYASVRHDGGECFGIFRPAALSNCREAAYLGYFWDGERIHVHDMNPGEADAWLDDI